MPCATTPRRTDGGESLGRLLLEITQGDRVGVALAAAVECVQASRQLYGDHVGHDRIASAAVNPVN